MLFITTTVIIMYSIGTLGRDNCPSNSSNVIRMCRPVTVTNKSRYTIEFADFELTSVASCECSFIAPSRGSFEMAPTTFSSVNNCGTRIERTVNNVVMAGGRVECKRDPFLAAEAFTGETVSVTISSISSLNRIAPYCYVATFPVNVTFTCTSSFPESASTSVKPPTTTSATTTTTAAIPLTTTTEKSTTVTSSISSTTSTTASTTTDSSMNTLSKGCVEENTCQNTGYIVGLVLQSVVICILLGIITVSFWRKQNEKMKASQSHIYEQSTNARDDGNMQTYESIRDQSSSNIYLNTTLDKD